MKRDRVIIKVPGATEILKFTNGEQTFDVKVFNQNFRFDSICNDCKRRFTCDKALSSIRIFFDGENIRLNFCNKLVNNSTSPTLTQTSLINTIEEIQYYRENSHVYFDKFCSISNHQ